MFEADAIRGLGASPKTLPCKYFYDKRGSLLFDEICLQPEYYLTRAETRLLEAHVDELVGHLGTRATLVELGSGSSIKTRIVLDRATDLERYVPVDVSAQHLEETAQALRSRYPHLEIVPLVLDYTATFPAVAKGQGPTAVFFPGSSIGNFAPAEVVHLFASMRKLAAPDGVVVVGVDMPKERRTLERAYDDEAGVTARFNKNLLERLNRDGADFDVAAFDHRAVWQPEHHRIEMQLVSRRAQKASFAGHTFQFAEGEPIVTEHCHKWSPDELIALAAQAELRSRAVLFDAQKLMSMHVLGQ
jgi:L-histidine N-alpha-methyltransferase